MLYRARVVRARGARAALGTNKKIRTLSHISYGPWGATNLGERRIGEASRVADSAFA